MNRPRKLIVGLQNPGKKFEGDRHNIGAVVVQKLARQLSFSFRKKACLSQIACQDWEAWELILALPETFMNESGEAVQRLVQQFQVDEERDLLVIIDDADLPVGKIRLRERGSSGGHRGLESIIDVLGRSDFPRLRIGIGRPPGGKKNLRQYVLEKWSSADRERLEDACEHASEAVLTWIREGGPKAMSRFNL